MTNLYERTTASDSVPEIVVFDHHPAEPVRDHRARKPAYRWALGAGVAAAMAIFGYVLIGDDESQPAPTIDLETVSDTAHSNTKGQFHGAPDEGPDGISGGGEFQNASVVRTDEDTFVNYVTYRNWSDDTFRTTTSRSSDGETWEPIETTGLPDGKLLSVERSGSELIAHVFSGSEPIGGDNRVLTAVSTDGLDWTVIDEPDDRASGEGDQSAALEPPPPGLIAGYDGTTYRVTSGEDGPVQVLRSTDDGLTWAETAPLNERALVRSMSAGPAGVALFAIEDLGFGAMEADQSRFDYVAPDGTRLRGKLPRAKSTWILTTPSGETYTYDLDGSLMSSEGTGTSDDNVIVVGGIPTIEVLSPLDGSTLLAVTEADLSRAEVADTDSADVSDDRADDFSEGLGVVYFSADHGASWQVLASINAKYESLAVDDDAVILAGQDLSGAEPTRIPVPTG